MFKTVNLKQSFPDLEKEIIKFWKENKIFEKSISTRWKSEAFEFYDGPPFATWTPHYWHLLWSTIKDLIPRYQTMKWKKVNRIFWWDCHWLPIENIVEKKMNISWKDDIEKIWIKNFNEECRLNVFWYTNQWEKIIERLWRWVDMENSYKTMDKEFMESIWWIYKTLYDKWLIYEWNRVVPYCPRCTTPLSNFEISQWYIDRQDKAVTVKFKVKWNDNKYILAWTTTPWTLASNLGLAVWKDIEYVELFDKKTNETYILAKERINNYYKDINDYSIIKTYKWACLEWIKYFSIFNDFEVLNESWLLDKEMKIGANAYSVVIGHHVTTESGTWIVHIAPAYWIDDNIIWQKSNLGFVFHINDSWKTSNLLEHNSLFIFDFNELVIKKLKDENISFLINTINHSYPHCWRCDTPLIYRAISAWYIAVEKIKDKLIKNNKEINWVPNIIKEGRFWTWLESARDWNISRNRYWWSAIPIWQNADKNEEICIWTIDELYELNKSFWQIEKKLDIDSNNLDTEPKFKYYYTNTWKEIDLHKHFVDDILIKNPKTWNTLKRIAEVLDCWFESWWMPYASKHYPFTKKENFTFPADFIAEWLDQTRWWFYTLLILGTALFDQSPYKNVIVNGIVLAEDGKKMSKKLNNYPNPNYIMDKYWSDAMRFYMMNSSVVEWQDIRFSELWVEEVVKKVILPLWNTYYFFTTYANIDKYIPKKWNVYYVRHWETDNNKNNIINWINNDSLDINENWILQCHKLWKQILAWWIKFDIIISSPLKRTKHTANIIKSYLDYDIDTIYDDNFREQSHWEYKGMKIEDLINKLWLKKDEIWMKKARELYRNNSEENIEQFIERVEKAYKSLEEKYPWKNILLVSHWWVFRVINKIINNLSIDEAFFQCEKAENAKLYKLPNYTKYNNLDKWIISELHTLIKEVDSNLGTYKINYATRKIVKFMDNLTNWYIRRSRKRFWKSESDLDKYEAYNTLFDVLIDFNKLISPIMPFISEYIYKELSSNLSIHLELFPEYIPWFVLDNLNKDTNKLQNIINLWLAFRARNKIRVRQALKYIVICEELSDYYKDIIKDELNIKEVRLMAADKLAKKVCKPNGKTIWPKFWKNVKFILEEAKLWHFEELENWNIKIWDFELETWDYEIIYEKNNLDYDIEVWFGTLISMDKEIWEELLIEWFARDIVRYIQESRKEVWYNISDRIEINIIWEIIDTKFIDLFGEYIERETLSKINNKLDTYDIKKDIIINNKIIKIILKK